MWAAVLIPMWLRNHDNAAESRSVERFGQAMRVLSRKEREDRSEEGLSDGRSDGPPVPASAHPPAQQTAGWRMDHHLEWTDGEADPVTGREIEQEVRRRVAPRSTPKPVRQPLTLAQRRARTLGVLAGITLLTFLVAVVGVLPLWTPLPFAALLGAFVVHLRIQARQREQRRRVRPAHAFADESVLDEPVAATPRVAAEKPKAEQPTSTFVPGPSRAMVVETKGAARAAAKPTVENETAASATEEDDETWRPNPLPLPTYVTAPKAMRPIKVIDLTTPGAWSSGRLFDDELAEEDLLAAQVEGEELDAMLEREANPAPSSDKKDDADRRAVGD